MGYLYLFYCSSADVYSLSPLRRSAFPRAIYESSFWASKKGVYETSLAILAGWLDSGVLFCSTGHLERHPLCVRRIACAPAKHWPARGVLGLAGSWGSHWRNWGTEAVKCAPPLEVVLGEDGRMGPEIKMLRVAGVAR